MTPTESRDKVDEIKSRLDIVDVINRDVRLQHKGNGEYVGTIGAAGHSGESLKVDKNRQVWKDFKHGNGGDVLDWIGSQNRLDARGTDFPEVLRIAAELACVELEEMTEEDRTAAKEKADIHNLFTDAADIYYRNLTERPEICTHISQKWGISREIIDKYKIGYATTGRDLKDLDKTTLKKSGLVYVNGGMTGGEVFTGRIIFPYWKNGKVVYLIGRETDETPEAEHEKGMKYKKLLVYKEGREYVSPAVQNSYFYGEDSLRGSDYCIITEGVADCIAMLQAGFPCISPVTVQFREKDNPKLLSLTKGLNRVYICNDNEANKAGLKGALSTAEALDGAGIETRLIILPKPEDLDKIDIADYMKEHSPEDFRGLIESSVRLWTYKLNQQSIPASSTSLERIRAFKNFILNDLQGMNSEEWTVFVNNEVPKKFRLNKKDTKITINAAVREWFKRQNDAQTQTAEQTQEKKTEAEERLNEYPERIRELAYTILKEGDAFDFMRETWNLRHVGDTNLGENCLCSIGSTFILNSDMGLHIKPSGESGKGKSDAMKEATLLLPAHKCISGSLSGKALFYDKTLQPGTIIYSDDAHLNDDIIATIKQSTSCFQEVTKHRTVVNGELKVFDIPERVVFWFSSVDGISDEQLANRFLNADVDCSEAQDKRVHDHINDKESLAYSPVDDDILICRCIFDILDKERYVIKIPFSKAIDWRNKENRRNYQKFLDIIRAVTLFNVFQRRNVNGIYLSDIEDFERAVDIYTGTSKNNATNLTAREIEVLKFIADKNKYDNEGKPISENPTTKQDIMKKFNISSGRAHQILHGKDGKGGMLAKVAQLHKVEKSITTGGPEEDRETTRKNEYVFTGKKFGLEIYDTVAIIDKKLLTEVEKEFMKTLMEETVTHCYPTITPNKVTVKTSTEERIKRNVTLKKENGAGNRTTHNSKQSKEKVYAKNSSISQNKKEGNSSKETSQPKTKTTVTHRGNSEVIEGNSLNDAENKGNSSIANENILAVVDMLKRALHNYAKNKYKKAITDLTDFVNSFNKDVPNYVDRLGEKIVFDEVKKLREWGRI